MTKGIKRRTLLGTIAAVAILAGCTGDIREEESNNDNESTDTDEDEPEESEETDESDEELTEEEVVGRFDSLLEEEGIETETVDRNDDILRVVYNATGMTTEAVTTEIEIIADAYVRAVNTGLTTNRLEASVRDPEEGSILDTFVIETEWVEAYSNEEIEWNEYVERISETFESDNPGD